MVVGEEVDSVGGNTKDTEYPRKMNNAESHYFAAQLVYSLAAFFNLVSNVNMTSQDFAF